MKTLLLITVAVAAACNACAANPATLQDKTLVAWVAPANLTQRGGSVLTIEGLADIGPTFDGIVFGEIAPARWMAGSEMLSRTEQQQAAWPAETAGPDTFVQIAIVYHGNGVTTYRNGAEYSHHASPASQPYDADSIVLIGQRHTDGPGFFAGAVDDARIYDRALTAAELAALQPNSEGAIKPWAWWTFDDADAKDHVGRFAQNRLTPGAKVENGRLILDGVTGSFYAARRTKLLPVVPVTGGDPGADVEAPVPLSDKTLVAWVAPANLTQRGGSVLTLFDGRSGGFDGVVFGEVAPQKWMAGSENYRRTERQQTAWPAETADANTLVQIALVYRGNEIVACRNGVEYSRHTIKEPAAFGADSILIIGPRHPGECSFFAGAVDDARIYDRVLTVEEIAALQPNIEGAIKPWAWWSFDDAAATDRTGRFATRLTAGTKIENGRLVLDGREGSLWAADREELLDAIAPASINAAAVAPVTTALVAHGTVPNTIRLPDAAGFTLTANLAGLPDTGDANLAGESAADGDERWRLAVAGDGPERRLFFELRINGDPEVVKEVGRRFVAKMHCVPANVLADAKDGLFRVIAPLRLIGSGPHQVTVRLISPVWEMNFFVDGVLLDVEWPLGAMVATGQAFVPHEAVTAVNVETNLLTDEQIIARNGGKDAVAKRETEFLGPDVSGPPFFRPRGFNTHTGDCAPVFDGKRWHLYYLKDRDHWQNRWGWGGLSYGHISSDDLVHWVEHPDAVKISHPYEGAIWTGSFAKIGDEYFGFLNNWLIPQWLQKYNTKFGVRIARSKDGIHFAVPEGDQPIPGVDGGDADIFELEDGRYGLVTRGDRPDQNQVWQRQTFFYTSKDLKDWKEEKSPFAFAQPNCDCPNYFRFAGGHYFFSASVARKGESLHGPWQDMPHSSLGVPKTAPWKDGRRIIVGMIGDGGWGGDGGFHELLKLPDGTLGEKFIPEMTPLRGAVLDLKPVSLIGTAEVKGQTVTVKSAGEFAAAMVAGIPQLARIRLTACPAADCKTFGLTFRGTGDYASGIALILNPSEKTVAFNHVAGTGKHVASGIETLTGVEGLDQAVSFDIIQGPEGLVDVELNGRRCLIMRGDKNPACDRLFLFADGGNATFEAIAIRPWEPVVSMSR